MSQRYNDNLKDLKNLRILPKNPAEKIQESAVGTTYLYMRIHPSVASVNRAWWFYQGFYGAESLRKFFRL